MSKIINNPQTFFNFCLNKVRNQDELLVDHARIKNASDWVSVMSYSLMMPPLVHGALSPLGEEPRQSDVPDQ